MKNTAKIGFTCFFFLIWLLENYNFICVMHYIPTRQCSIKIVKTQPFPNY